MNRVTTNPAMGLPHGWPSATAMEPDELYVQSYGAD
jgi:hypothetical protein